jgi:hypothetical protein
MAIKSWSTTAGDNDDADATINWLENQAPSTVNNSGRAMMAAVRSWYEDVEWRDLGHTVNRTGNTTFTIATDVTATYVANRPIRCSDSSTLYGYIASSAYSAPNTTVTVTLDSGTLSASLSAVSLGLTPSTKSIPSAAIRNDATSGFVTLDTTQAISGAKTFSANPTIQSTDAGASAGPDFILDRNSASPAANDLIGRILWKMRDSAANTDNVAAIVAEILDTTNGSEDIRLLIQTIVAGTLATRGYWGQGLVIGSPTGGDKGAGTINVATELYRDGTAIGQAGLVKLASGSVSAGASLSLDLTTYTAYTNKLLKIWAVQPATNATKLYMRVSTNGGSSYDAGANDYFWSNYGQNEANTSANNSSGGSGTAQMQLNSGNLMSSGATDVGWWDIDIPNSTSTGSYPKFGWSGGHRDSSGNRMQILGSGQRNSAQDTDAIQILTDSGNISLSYLLLGYAA